MATHIATKPSHLRRPRMMRDAQFNWADGAEPYPLNKPSTSDKWSIAMMAVAVVGACVVVLYSIFA